MTEVRVAPELTREQKRLLIVEDEKSLRSLFELALARDGRIVETCSDGVEALQAVEDTSFDLILLDLRMPRLDGVGFLRRLRSGGNYDRVIICSAELDVWSVASAIRNGVVTFLAKPVSLSIFRRIVEQHLAPPGISARERALRQIERMRFGKALLEFSAMGSSGDGSQATWRQLLAKLRDGGTERDIIPEVRTLIDRNQLIH